MRDRHLRLNLGVAALAGLLTGCDAILAPTTPDANWRVSARGHFTFYVRPGSFAEQSLDMLSAVLDDQFAASVRTLGLRYDGTIMMFLHNSGAEAGLGGDAEGGNYSGVAYSKTETVKTVCVPPLDANLFGLLSHESNHVIVWNGLGRPGTTFVNEGLASALISERYGSHGPSYYYTWTATHRSQLPRLADLIGDDTFGSIDQPVAYSASASFLAYLLETRGAAPMRAIYPVSSAAFARAFQDRYGLTLETAEAAWLAFCEARRRAT